MNTFRFTHTNIGKGTRARLGVITTPHGQIQTPAFVPVGTQATVKSLTPAEIKETGTELFFVNTYHTYLRPSLAVIKKFGGLHRFMGWNDPIITDSGGFQVFSLGGKKLVNIAISESAVLDRERFAKRSSRREDASRQVFPDDYKPIGALVAIDEDGVTFTSHWDGIKHRFTPERSLKMQHILGSDIMIAFDECTPYPTTYQYAVKAMERTHRWAVRSLEEHKRLSNLRPVGRQGDTQNLYQALYGVVQGSIYEDLRKDSANVISAMDFDGIAIGGVSVGESKEEMRNVLKWVTPLLPDHKPRHLLGVGEVDDVFVMIEHGIDTFDCVQPTRLARMGRVFVSNESYTSNRSNKTNHRYEIDITKKLYATDTGPLDPMCTCMTCAQFSRAYLYHLFHVKELLGYRLATLHNIHFMHTLVAQIRASLLDGTFHELKKRWIYDTV